MTVSLEQALAVRAVVGAAFADDPMFTWMLAGADATRASRTAALLGLYTDTYAVSGRLDVLTVEDEVVAAAAWRIPSDAPLEHAALPVMGELFAELVGAARLESVGAGVAMLPVHRPAQPHAYLHILGVAPEHQRKGYGRRVVQPGIEAADVLGLGVQLETMKASNVAFYRTLGFEVTAEERLGDNGPQCWWMYRPPMEASS